MRLRRHSIALILCAVAVAQQDWPAGLQEAFRKAVEAQKAGRLEEAEKGFLGVLAQGGKAAFVYNNLGIVYRQRGEHAKAIGQFREALRLDADYAQPRALLGASLLAVGRVEEALAELRRAEKQLPDDPLVLLSLARALSRTGDPEGAVEKLRKLRRLNPREPEYAYLLGRAYLELSAHYFRRIRSADPDSARFHQVIGENYFLEGRYREAIPALERALKADPHLPGVHLTLARIYLKLGRPDDARRELDAELAVMPTSALAKALRRRLEQAAAPRE